MTETNESLIVDVDVKESDLQRAYFWFGLNGWSNRLMLIFLPITGLLLLRRINVNDLFQRPVPLTLVVLCFGLAPFYLGLIWVQTKRGFANQKPWQTKVQYTISPNGYKVSDAKCSAEIAWEAVLRAAESKHSFHIFFSKSRFHTIPKRCFKHADDVVHFRNLLKSSLGTKAALLTTCLRWFLLLTMKRFSLRLCDFASLRDSSSVVGIIPQRRKDAKEILKVEIEITSADALCLAKTYF